MRKTDAIRIGSAAKARMKGSGWNLHVWQENIASDDSLGSDLQWVFELRNRSVRVIPENPKGDTFICLICKIPNETVDDIRKPEMLIGSSVIVYNDPNAAVMQAMLDANANMQLMSKLFSEAVEVVKEMKNEKKS